MFVVEILLCVSTYKCVLMREDHPVFFKTQETCIEHGEAKFREMNLDPKEYTIAIVRCNKVKSV